MSVGEFTASNIAVDQDNQELKAERKGTIDYTKLDADIKATKELAAKVRCSVVTSALQFYLLETHDCKHRRRVIDGKEPTRTGSIHCATLV